MPIMVVMNVTRAWLIVAVVAACRRPEYTILRGCEFAVSGAPSVSIVRASDTTTSRLAVRVTTPFPAHKPIGGAVVQVYGDTVESRAAAPLRAGAADDSGRVTLEALPAGRYGLRASAVGYERFFSIVDMRRPVDTLVIRLTNGGLLCY